MDNSTEKQVETVLGQGPEENVKEVFDVPGASEMFGGLTGPQEVPLENLFAQFKIPEELRYSLKIKPMSAKVKAEVESYLAKMSLEGVKWAKENDIDLDMVGRPLWTQEVEDSFIQAIKDRGEEVPEELDLTRVGYLPKDKTFEDWQKYQRDLALYEKYLSSLDDRGFKYSRLQRSVVGLENFHNRLGEKVDFRTQGTQDFIATDLWDTLPSKVKEVAFSCLLDISGLTDWEIRSL